LIRPVIQIKPVERDALFANGDYDEVRTNRPVEPIAIHSQVIGCIAQANESRQVPKYPSMNRVGNRAGHATRVGRHANVSNLQGPEMVGFPKNHH
jgi:hypothetical protein